MIMSSVCATCQLQLIGGPVLGQVAPVRCKAAFRDLSVASHGHQLRIPDLPPRRRDDCSNKEGCARARAVVGSLGQVHKLSKLQRGMRSDAHDS